MGNAANLRKFNYSAVWNGVDLGYTNATVIDPQLAFTDKKVGSLNGVTLGAWTKGADPFVELEFSEITRTMMEKLSFWFAGSAGQAIKLVPPLGIDIYTYAQLLVLHPSDLAAGVTSQDPNLLKAV